MNTELSRALAPDPAYLSGLFTAGTRFDTARRGPVTVEIADAGTLRLPSGRVVAKDPTYPGRVAPFTVTVPPGEYPVLLSAARFDRDPGHTRIAAAKLVIRGGPARSWEMALLPGQDPRRLGDEEFYGFGVDAGTGCFRDAAAGADLVAYETGWGDGSYPTWIGRDRDGNVTCFVSDMLLIP